MDGSLDWVNSIITLSTAGGFGALLWYFVIKHIPSIEQRHQTERAEWLAYMQRRDEDQRQRDEKLEAVIQSFRDTLKEVTRK